MYKNIFQQRALSHLHFEKTFVKAILTVAPRVKSTKSIKRLFE